MTYDAYVLSDVGRVREHNEDDALMLPSHHVFVVADGMGGHACGEVAARISVQSIHEFYADPELTSRLQQLYKGLRKDNQLNGVRSFHQFRLKSAIEYGNRQIHHQSTQDEDLADMGTTVVGIAFVKSRVYVAHVGDSRAYRLRKGRLVQLTEDHSLANEFIRMNVLKPEDLPRFPYKNVIVRALGLQEDVAVDTFYRQARPGDRYMLCSDGLSDLVSNDEIGDILLGATDVRTAARVLVERALELGGVDNITVLVVDAS